ncbi:MAG: S8 family peptidase [Chitinophagaceae bacterium]
MKSYKHTVIVLLLFLGIGRVFGQTSVNAYEKGWHLEDPSTKAYGIKLEQAYADLLKQKTPKKKIIVAVIDSGIDTAHEDLKPVIWRNDREIAGNGIDDDKNGYVDDTNGWNFIGGKDGSNVGKDSYEAARVYYKYKPEFGDKTIDENSLTAEKKKAFQIYSKAKFQLESQAKEAAMYVLILKDIVAKLPSADSILKIALGKPQYTGDELANFTTSEPAVAKARAALLGFFQQTKQMESTNSALISELIQFYEGEKSKMEAVEKEPKRYRAEVVKDNYDNPNDRFYGNNDVMGTDASHGTHVAGIIGANRNNNKGINGVADHVAIMPIRAVPDGDEHDKDIDNAIRYAVDNGAWVINMSFGKSFSPEKSWVDEAVKYAASKGVLLVHAAGNDAKNIDIEDNFPSRNFNNDTLQPFSNWITVGASGATQKEIAASFSNYGKREVDVFAPGVRIYSTIPGGNTYGEMDGTSMASPVVAGLAALILSHYPDLTPEQIISIIKSSSLKITDKVTIKPGTEDEEISLLELSSTGGVVNAYDALKLAANTKGERKTTTQIKKTK